jgi:hypothetical protein
MSVLQHVFRFKSHLADFYKIWHGSLEQTLSGELHFGLHKVSIGLKHISNEAQI